MMLTNIFLTLPLVLALLSGTVTAQFEGSQQWWDLARTELAAALNVRDNWGVAKNVIMFIGDGMGITASTAARIYKGQKKGMHGEEGYLEWERFPNSALIKTYNVDRQVPDSAATATAYLCGVKVNYETLGVDSRVMFDDCQASKDPNNQLSSVLQWAQEAGKATGLVTSTRITHATPAATYARAANRRWECNSDPGQAGHGCPDIADQLVNYNPGKNIKVILGGGRQPLGATLGIPTRFSCNRTDGRDLTMEWLQNKKAEGHRARYITSASELRSLDLSNTDYLMGLFADSHIPYVVDQPPTSSNSPSMAEMTRAAITMLSKDNDGYFLLVEGGRIDHAYHNNQPMRGFEETLAFEESVTAALQEINLDDTLVLVTADHSHVITINGYPKRGNDILGMADVSEVDGLPYTTIMFTNGPGFNMTTNGVNVTRADPRLSPLTDPNNLAQTAVPMKAFDETHGGEDVALFAAGPMSHLFHRTHEQHYIPHVMAYAACIGPSAGQSCQRPSFSSTSREEEDLFSLPVSTFNNNPKVGFIDSNTILGKSLSESAAQARQVASSASIMSRAASSRDRPQTQSSASPSPASGASAPITSNLTPISNFKTAGKLTTPKLPSLSPTLQQLLENSQQQLINSLGVETIKHASFSSSDDVRRLLGRPAVGPLPHFL